MSEKLLYEHVEQWLKHPTEFVDGAMYRELAEAFIKLQDLNIKSMKIDGEGIQGIHQPSKPVYGKTALSRKTNYEDRKGK